MTLESMADGENVANLDGGAFENFLPPSLERFVNGDVEWSCGGWSFGESIGSVGAIRGVVVQGSYSPEGTRS